MAEIQFDNLYDQLGLLDQKFYDSTFKNTYDPNKSQPMLEGKPGYDQMKAVYEAQQQVPKKSILDSINIFSSADAAMPDNQYGIGSIDMSAYYTPEQQALMFGDPNYFGNQQFYEGSNVPVATPFSDSMNEPMGIENFLGTSTPKNLGFIENAPEIKEAIYQDRIRQQNLPGFAYEPNQNFFEKMMSGAQNKLGGAWDKTKEIGTRFKEGAAPVFGVASMIANATNPLNPKAFNYNPELAGQLNFMDEQFPGMMVNNPTSGLLQYAQGTPLAGQNVMSIAGSNDPIAQLEKQMARHQKTIDKLTNEGWGDLTDAELKDKIQIHQNRFNKAQTLHDTILANKKSRIAERIKNERAAGAAANQATQRRAGRGGDHMSRSRSQGGLGISRAQAQAVSDANRAAGMGGWGLARGGRVGYANGGLASLFTRRG